MLYEVITAEQPAALQQDIRGRFIAGRLITTTAGRKQRAPGAVVHPRDFVVEKLAAAVGHHAQWQAHVTQQAQVVADTLLVRA